MVSAAVVGALTVCTCEPLHIRQSPTLLCNRSNGTTSSSSPPPASIVRDSRFRHGIRRGACGLQIRAGVASSPRTGALQYKKLGDSDLLISEITLGTMTWGNQNTEKEAHEQLCYAFDNGINIFDSAENYPIPMSPESQGRTDRYISTWLKSMPRDKVIVATKVAGYSEKSTYLRDSGQTVRVNEENITESVEKSLKRLGTDHIDLLQIHW